MGASKNNRQTVAIKIGQSELDVAIMDRSRDGKQVQVRTRSMPWRIESRSLHIEQGVRELGAAMKTLVNREKLTGAKIYITLSGDFCVTRVVAGNADRVRDELRQLEERSSLYLSLGPGEKSVAGAARQIDARHQHAWLSATNKKTLDAIQTVAENCSIEVELVEPSLIAACRAVGAMEHDAESPALVIAIDENGVEVGIAFQGRLLLDHRPAGMSSPIEIAQTVGHHLERLQRYCDRHFRYATGKISQVFLCGPDETVEQLVGEFQAIDDLEAVVLDPQQVNTDWQLDAAQQCSRDVVVLGTLLGAGLSHTERNCPNLMEQIQSELREPLVRGLVRLVWPMAAAVLIAVALYGLSAFESRQETRLVAELAALEKDKIEVRKMQHDLTAAEAKAKELGHLAKELESPEWNTLVATIAHCMPKDVWLEAVYVDPHGKVSISGNSYGEDGVFEFVRWLKQAPTLEKVALESTQPVKTNSGPATRFDVHCDLADRTGSVEKEDQDG